VLGETVSDVGEIVTRVMGRHARGFLLCEGSELPRHDSHGTIVPWRLETPRCTALPLALACAQTRPCVEDGMHGTVPVLRGNITGECCTRGDGASCRFAVQGMRPSLSPCATPPRIADDARGRFPRWMLVALRRLVPQDLPCRILPFQLRRHAAKEPEEGIIDQPPDIPATGTRDARQRPLIGIEVERIFHGAVQ